MNTRNQTDSPLATSETLEVSGYCWANLTWRFDKSTGALTIEGSGTMLNFIGYKCDPPWSQFSSQIKTLTLPNGILNIGDRAFKSCTGLKSATIPKSVIEIGDSAFEGCTGLKSLEISGNVSNIGARAFAGCTGLESLVISEYVHSFGSHAFAGCTGLKSVVFPKCREILEDKGPGFYMFAGCTGLKSLEFATDVTSISDGTFFGCTGLKI